MGSPAAPSATPCDKVPRPQVVALLVATAGWIALVIEPVRWLMVTWRDPSFQSDGAWVAAAGAGLVIASLASGRATPNGPDRRWAIGLLLATGALRVASELLAIRIVGGLALVVDAAALAAWLRVDQRPRALHLGAITGLFALALPIENLLQRIAGHPMQLAAATITEVMARPLLPELARAGTVLRAPGVELGVDLPCSGAHGLWLLTSVAVGVAVCRRCGVAGGIRLAIAALVGALAANVLRIAALLAGGVAGWPVWEGASHQAIGAAALACGALPVCWVAAALPARRPSRTTSGRAPLPRATGAAWPLAGIAVTLAIVAQWTPARPLDVSRADASPLTSGLALPDRVGTFDAEPLPLTERELRYYRQFGGDVDKRRYADFSGIGWSVIRVRTRSPLRHLHGPDRCLLGAGHRVDRVGITSAAPPSILYRSVAPDGTTWRVEATFVSEAGEIATSVSEVVWHWLAEPDTAWSVVQRVSPWAVCENDVARCRQFDAQLFAALEAAPPPALVATHSSTEPVFIGRQE